jgi:hypothetical protein
MGFKKLRNENPSKNKKKENEKIMHCFQVHVKYLSRLTIAGPLQMMDT